MANQYKQFLNLIKKWPSDQTKPGRDVAIFIQDEVKKAFSRGVLSEADEERCSRFLASLTRLNNNVYGEKYKRTRASSSTGLTREQCNAVLSQEFLEELKYKKTGLFSFIRKK